MSYSLACRERPPRMLILRGGPMWVRDEELPPSDECNCAQCSDGVSNEFMEEMTERFALIRRIRLITGYNLGALNPRKLADLPANMPKIIKMLNSPDESLMRKNNKELSEASDHLVSSLTIIMNL